MKQFEKFIIKPFEFNEDSLVATFHFSFDDEIFFAEEIDFSCKGFNLTNDISKEALDWLLFHLSIALAISYYKLSPTTNIILEHWYMDEYQKTFWKKFYIQWLGEFFFKNNISPLKFWNFVNQNDSSKPIKYTKIKTDSQKALVTLWWWKDSLFVTELFQEFWIDFDTCTFWKDYVLHNTVWAEIWVPRLVIKRKMDSKLFQMNQEWYYNGHVPITWIIAFVLEVAAYLYDYQYIVLANEKSANEWNTYMDWININHQYSKSFEFESDFDEYVSRYVSDDIKYFSLLRGMYEIFIAREFIKYWKYFDVFSSCNNNFKIIEQNKTTKDRWCGKCPKCAFVYSIFRPFANDAQLEMIFGNNLYNDKSLETLFKELLWISGIKPFECVGTNEEVVLAMYLYYQTLIQNNLKLPFIIQIFERDILSKMEKSDFKNLEKKLFHLYNDLDFIPHDIRDKLFVKYKSN